MRFAKGAVIFVLAVSLLANYVLVNKTLSRRMHVKINGATYTKGDYYNWLEQHFGTQATAQLMEYMLVTQAAKQAKCEASSEEIDAQLKDAVDMMPERARQWKVAPYLRDDARQALQINMDLQNLSIRSVPATDDQLRQFYVQNPGRWDEPDRIYTSVAAARTESGAQAAKRMMEQNSDMTAVAEQLRNVAVVQGVNGTFMFKRPFGGKCPVAWMNAVAALGDGQVVVEKVPQSGANPAKWIAIRRDKIVPGRHVTYEEAKDNVARDFKLTRATPTKEVLRKLWQDAKIETEDSRLKDAVERFIFQDAGNPANTATQ